MAEVRALSQLDHRCLLQLRSAWKHDETIYLVTDLFEAGDLLQLLLLHGALTTEFVAWCVAEVLSGLQHLHCQGA